MQLENLTMQGGTSVSLVPSHACVCQTGAAEPARQLPPSSTCSVCGGSRPQAPEAPRPARRERRKLEDFLSAFV